MAIDKHTFFNFNHYLYGEAFYGSYEGMRYRLAREPLENVFFVPVDKRGPATLRATIWPEPYAYGHTDTALMKSEDFEFSEEGLEAAVKWFNEQHEAGNWQK